MDFSSSVLAITLSSITMATNFELFALFLFMISLTAEASSQVSLSGDLIHRDSPLSPFYNPSHTHSDRIHNAFLRSISRARHFHRSKSLHSKVTTGDNGEFLMKISLGMPPKTIIALIDTGSDLIWTQCKPCEECFNQTVHPIFDPRQSSTYHDLSCDSTPCKALDKPSCNTAKTCNYSYSYGDNSYTHGNLATETLTMLSTRGRQVSFPGFVVGCGHKNGGKFDESGSGIIGLGGNPFSLVSQLGKSHNISKQFSYCFVSASNATSKIIFGSESVVSGPTTVSTPLQIIETFYVLTLEAISVGNKKLVYESSSKGGIPKKGYIIIDSGSTLTSLNPIFYKKLETVLVEEMGAPERVKDPTGDLSYCLRDESVTEFPVIKVHFTGAEVELKKDNIFAEVAKGVMCFTVVPTAPNHPPIFGFLAQTDFLVGYDLVKKTVSFTPTECSAHM